MSIGARSPEDEYVEQPAIEWLEGVGWDFVHGPDIAPDGQAPERETWRDVVLSGRLKASLAARYPDIPEDDLELIVSQIQTTTSPEPILDHQDFHRLLIEGIPFSYNDADGVEKTEQVKLVDFEKPLDNDYCVVNQMTIIVGQKNRRPDLLLFVNGLPLGQIELKSPIDEKATPERAVAQVEHYAETIPPLYRFVEIVGVSDLKKGLVGTISTPVEHFAEWKTMDKSAYSGGSELELLIREVFAPERFLRLISDFVLFESDGKKTFKIMAKYHQVDAVERAVEATYQAIEGDGRAGVVWHTQGSGKSYSMVFFTQILRRDPRFKNPTIVAVTDRVNLDNQLMETFAKQAVLGPAVSHAESAEDLRDELKRRVAGGVIFTVINKFRPPAGENEMPVLSERENIIVLSDEAHRSQYRNFAANLQKALPNATRIGFTGTPIETTDRSTRTTFGDYISIYNIARAVEDGATVKILYENRAIPLEITDDEMVAEVEALLADEGDEAADKVVRTETKLDRLGGSPERLDTLAQDIVEHFGKRQEVLEGKGMAVAMNRRIAVELTERLKEAWGDEAVTCVISASADEEGLNRYRRSSAEIEEVAKEFRDPDSALRFVVVCDMWLTGFDAPVLNTMYIDKPMRNHGLLQAIARVNRVFRDKPSGLIVDYIGIGDDLRKSLPAYSADDVNEAAIEIEEFLRSLREKHDVVAEFFHGLDYSNRADMSPTEQANLLIEAHGRVVADEEQTKRFLKEQALFAKFFAMTYTRPEAQALAEDAQFFSDVARSVRKYTSPDGEPSDAARQAIKQFFSEGLAAGEVVDIFGLADEERPEISILDDKFLDSIEERISQPDLQVALLKKLLRDEIGTRSGVNQRQAKLFGDQLSDVLARYANRQLTSAEVVKALVEMAKDLRQTRQRPEQLGLSEEETAFYDALAANPDDVEVDPQLAEISRELVASIKGDLSVDWTSRASREAAIRRKVKRLLRKHGYQPPAGSGSPGGGKPTIDQLTDLILDQARVMYRNWPQDPTMYLS
jgi:type I restriction enzyme R subunit